MPRRVSLMGQFMLSQAWAEPPHVRVLYLGLLGLCDGGSVRLPQHAMPSVMAMDQPQVDEALIRLSELGMVVIERDGSITIPDHSAYRALRSSDARRHQNAEAQRRHRAKDPQPQAVATPEAAPERKPRRGQRLNIITNQRVLDAFNRIWDEWPSTRKAEGGGTTNARGGRAEAERAFLSVVQGGDVGLEELERAAFVYLKFHENARRGYVQNVSTFFGPMRGKWREAVKYVREHSENTTDT